MANSSAMCTSYKVELMTGTHNHTITTGNVFKYALYTSSATLGAATTAYSSTNEITGTGYTAAGFAWTAAQNVTPTSTSTTAFTDWSVDPSWSSASFTANAGLAYNSTSSNKAVASNAFGGDQTVSSGTFTVVLPTADSTNAILRLA